jgi:hypothetical protein
LKFGNQPLHKVSLTLGCGASTERQIPISVDIIFEFGKLAEANGLYITSIDSEDRDSFGSSEHPGFKLIHPNGVSLDVRSDVLVSRWSSSSGIRYPHFEGLMDAVRQFQKFHLEILGSLREFEDVSLSYTNYLQNQPGKGLFYYFKRKFFSEGIEAEPELCRYVWKSEHCTLGIQAETLEPDKAYTLTTIGVIEGQQSSDFEERGMVLNEELTRLFSNMLTEEAMKEWELQK